MPRYKQNSESFERKFMQKLAHKVSSLVQNFPIPGHNWKLDMDRAQKKYFRYFFSPSPLRLLWGWYHDLQSKYIGPGAFSQFQTRFRKIKLFKILKGDNLFSSLEKSDHSFHVNFLFVCWLSMERGETVSCWLHSKLFVVVHLGCSYLQISSNLKPTFTFLSAPIP